MNNTNMKLKLFVLGLFSMLAIGLSAQRIAFVESEYIFGKLKSYAVANESLEKITQEWQKDIENRMSDLEAQYKKFQAEQSLFTAQMKQEKIAEIEAKEKEIATLQQRRFGPSGDLFKKRQELIQPIMTKMMDEIQKIATAKSFDLVLDKSSGNTILFSNPKLNISDDVIKAMSN